MIKNYKKCGIKASQRIAHKLANVVDNYIIKAWLVVSPAACIAYYLLPAVGVEYPDLSQISLSWQIVVAILEELCWIGTAADVIAMLLLTRIIAGTTYEYDIKPTPAFKKALVIKEVIVSDFLIALGYVAIKYTAWCRP